MSQHFLFAGSFCPPTYGHLAVLKQAASMFPFVTVVCSKDEAKNNWFDQVDCAEMWRAYDLPENVEVVTFDIQRNRKVKGVDITLIRGIRNDSDFATEQRVIAINSRQFGIKNYVYILATDEMAQISASAARQAAQDVDLKTLASCVAPAIVTKLLEKARNFWSLYMVVGQPGGGKSTLGRWYEIADHHVAWVYADEISEKLRHIAEEHFGEDLVKVALEKSQELSDLIGEQWLELLAEEIRQISPYHRVFVEVAYGLSADKQIQRFLGNKVLYVGCDEETQRARVVYRGTPEHLPFFEVIPGLVETRRIAKQEGLELVEFNSVTMSPDTYKVAAHNLMLDIIEKEDEQ